MALKVAPAFSSAHESALVRQVVSRTLSPEEVMVEAIEDDGRQVTLRFRLVVDPVLLTQRMKDVERALSRAGHARKVLPMLRLI